MSRTEKAVAYVDGLSEKELKTLWGYLRHGSDRSGPVEIRELQLPRQMLETLACYAINRGCVSSAPEEQGKEAYREACAIHLGHFRALGRSLKEDS